MSSYGDWAALSDEVDRATAELLRRETSDGIIAPGYAAQALELLRAKRGGSYRVLEIDPRYRPPQRERREVFGVTLEQQRNAAPVGRELLADIPTAARELPEHVVPDILLALITLKYTQSNSVCIVYRGQTIGIGAGQQSRIHCTQLAVEKACAWHLRFHPALQEVRFRPGVRRHDRDTWTTQFVGGVQATDDAWLRAQVERMPEPLSPAARREWLAGLEGAVLASDGFFPHRDSIDVARRVGVRYVVQPGGSLRDADVVRACDEHGLVMALTGSASVPSLTDGGVAMENGNGMVRVAALAEVRRARGDGDPGRRAGGGGQHRRRADPRGGQPLPAPGLSPRPGQRQGRHPDLSLARGALRARQRLHLRPVGRRRHHLRHRGARRQRVGGDAAAPDA